MKTIITLSESKNIPKSSLLYLESPENYLFLKVKNNNLKKKHFIGCSSEE